MKRQEPSPQRLAREAEIAAKAKELEQKLADSGRAFIEVATCNHPWWDIVEHCQMPAISDKLKEDGYVVTRFKHAVGIIDYKISYA